MGKLVLVSLPIGNSKDITLRALEIFSKDGVFLAEDTRVLKEFLKEHQGKFEDKHFISFHEHNDREKIQFILKLLEENEEIFLTSDAGSPIISDPAYPLIKAALENHHEVSTLPGVSSVISAVELCGLPPYPFTFFGFLPKEENRKREIFKNLPRGLSLFFESPHRVMSTLDVLYATKSEVLVTVCREMTKVYESIYRFKIEDFPKTKDKIITKGEFVICIYQSKSGEAVTPEIEKLNELVKKYLSEKGSKKDLAKIFSIITNEDVKTIYDKIS